MNFQNVLLYLTYFLNIHMEIFKVNFLLHQNLQRRYGYAFYRAEMHKRTQRDFERDIPLPGIDLEIPQRISKTEPLFLI